MTKEEQIRREREIIRELRAKVEIYRALCKEVRACERKGIDTAIDAAFARLGLNSAREQLAAHKASLEIIERRRENEQSDAGRPADG